ncbi:MAG TPA: hypothetical protein PLU88_05945 [Armatimonadota bacterium]|nr:hypothetical protein [Armatimonadota bacterium]HOP80517.1 hypothetical protein [Armatimonadota bacterium]HPP74648.1 hypothetical protein [Armatimonadota bacterium]
MEIPKDLKPGSYTMQMAVDTKTELGLLVGKRKVIVTDAAPTGTFYLD